MHSSMSPSHEPSSALVRLEPDYSILKIVAPRWGEEGAPLLPKSLRRAFHTEPLPGKITRLLALPARATFAALDRRAAASAHDSPAVLRELNRAIDKRRREAGDQDLISRPWPDGLRPSDLALRTRTVNCLDRRGLLYSCTGWEDHTIGDILEIQGAGVMTALDLACTAEAALDLLGPHSDPVDPESLAGDMTLDDLLRASVKATTGWSGERLDTILARLGWSGEAPVTLDTASRRLDLSRERIRQMQEQAEGELRSVSYLVTRIASALETIRAAAPLPIAAIPELLVDEGITSQPLQLEGLIGAARIFEVPSPLNLSSDRDPILVIDARQAFDQDRVETIARHQAAASGASRVLEVVMELESRGLEVDASFARAVIAGDPRYSFLRDDWFWAPGGTPSRDRVRNISRKVLSVTGNGTVETLRAALLRARRGKPYRGHSARWPRSVPPESVLLAYYRQHPEFEVRCGGIVSPKNPLRADLVLGPIEGIIWSLLAESPGCSLPKSELRRKMRERGVNPSSVHAVLGFCPIVTETEDAYHLPPPSSGRTRQG